MTTPAERVEQLRAQGVLGQEIGRRASEVASTNTRHRGRGDTAGATSDLTIDETLLLHSIGWEPVDMVIGVSVASIPPSTFVMGWNSTDSASVSYTRAVASAVERLHAECQRRHAAGVIGVEVEFEVYRHHVKAVLVGTAVKPSSGQNPPGPAFVSDLSTRDFCLLHNAGWQPLGLAFGTAFVQVPRRSVGTALRQSTANVELTLLTEAMYQARETAMERMQSSALAMRAGGVVAVHVEEGPLRFARHCIAFTAWGTAIRLSGEAHRYLQPRMVVPVDDRELMFRVNALGAGTAEQAGQI
jgi:uncharacterized protein YbjQ (UPF0145 family)